MLGHLELEHSAGESRICYFGCLKGRSKSVQVLSNGIGAVVVLTLIVLLDISETASPERPVQEELALL